ncbi:peptide ABC transporter substrate-binding protein, partial [Streptomyces rhizosphaericola]
AHPRPAAGAPPAPAGARTPVTGGTFTVELEFDAEHLAAAATVVPGVAPSGERRVAYTGATMYEGIRTFKAVTTIVSAAVEEQYG